MASTPIERAVGIVSKWGRMTKEQMHSAVEDDITLQAVRKHLRETADLVLEEEPVALKEGIDCDLNEIPTGNASSDSVINTKLLERQAALIANNHNLRISQLAVKVLQTGIHRLLCEDVIHSHFIASRRWKLSPLPQTKFGGLALILSASEHWCNGNATPSLKLLSESDSKCSSFFDDQNVPEPGDVEEAEEEEEEENEEEDCPFQREDLMNYLNLQLKAATFRNEALREMKNDSCCEGSTTRYAEIEAVAADNEAVLSELLDDPHLPSNKKHPIWSYVYEALEERISERLAQKRHRQQEAENIKRRKEQQEREELSRKKRQARTTRKALGVKRGILVRKVHQIQKGDITTALKMRMT
eukprot:TRINITY_DN16860_c0_g2_i1.p1 TRINITY_DN16860_c0_g2~~TRINITY_DN16860_c0_g2_i1.p1  ORF type:complete len:378 (+),score=100.30 TRINITY_DN16860_c0_g2_i1:62-1135(+)